DMISKYFLLLGGFSSVVSSSPGPHSLRYNVTVESREGSAPSGFLAGGHLDGQLCLLCDRQKGRAGPRGQGAKAVPGDETWDTGTEDLAGNGKGLRMTLAPVKVPQSSRAQALTMKIQKVWDEVALRAMTHSGPCGRRRADTTAISGSPGGFRRAVTPRVIVTCSQAFKGIVTLMSWASGFCAQNISLAWCQGRAPLSQDTQQSGGVLPCANGTYQTWVATRGRGGEKQGGLCFCEHRGNAGDSERVGVQHTRVFPSCPHLCGAGSGGASHPGT
uniref:Uncharacterized protein n=1 Tax=Prolemur simus TaxID=1328070 RepID=A0A8C8YXJ0_PROSS